MDKARMKIVYAITTRPLNATHRTEAGGTRKYWNRIGIAFVNGDGSLNVKLEALPVSGELHIRDFVPHDEAKPVHRPSGNNQPALKRAAA